MKAGRPLEGVGPGDPFSPLLQGPVDTAVVETAFPVLKEVNEPCLS